MTGFDANPSVCPICDEKNCNIIWYDCKRDKPSFCIHFTKQAPNPEDIIALCQTYPKDDKFECSTDIYTIEETLRIGHYLLTAALEKLSELRDEKTGHWATKKISDRTKVTLLRKGR